MLLLVAVYSCYVIFVFFDTIKDIDSYSLTPKQIYKTSDMNIVFCTIESFISLIFNPLLYLIVFLRWISHVGRRKF